MALSTDALYQGDCIERLKEVDPGTIHLAFADPPFNIGYEYDVYKDNREYREYLDWTKQWMGGVSRALRPDGTFWIAIGDEYAAEFKLIAQNDLRLTCRSWVIWYYTFGVNCTRKFSRSHAHLFQFVKDAKKFTFNADDRAIRVPSARQLVYADGRANPKGRLPDDTWILRPQDVQNGFAPDQDTWYFPRVAGTFKERAGFHGCQMPEQLLGRIIRSSSNEGDAVLDPFAGSGTTLAVAKKLGRRWIGFELSEEYVKKVRARLTSVRTGQALDGAAEPLLSAPATPVVASNSYSPAESERGKSAGAGIGPPMTAARSNALAAASTPREKTPKSWRAAIQHAFAASHDGHSADYLLADPELNAAFMDACKREGIPGEAKDWNRRLLQLRKSSGLQSTSRRSRRFTWREMDSYAYASEIALSTLTERRDVTLDDILCDPILAAEFDAVAQGFAQAGSPFQFRWAALSIRKRAHDMRESANALMQTFRAKRLLPSRKWSELPFASLRETPGVYLLSNSRQDIYVGETVDLERRLRSLFDLRNDREWKRWKPNSVRFAAHSPDLGRRGAQLIVQGFQSLLIRRHDPVLNFKDLASQDSVAA